MDIKELYFNLGVTQAQLHLPLAFVDVVDYTFDSPQRTTSLETAAPVVNAVRAHIKEVQGLQAEPTDAELLDFMLNKGYVLTESVKMKKKGSSRVLGGIELNMSSNNAAIVNYCLSWNRNPGDAPEIADRIKKAVIDRYNGLIKPELNEEDGTVFAKLLKLDPNKNKITVSRVPSRVIFFAPFEQVQGYVQELLKLSTNNMIKLTYKKTNGVQRDQYITGSHLFLKAIYNTQPSMVAKYYDASLPTSTTFLGKQTPYSVLGGSLQIPDLGLSNHANTIMRKVNLGALEGVEVITDPTAPIIQELSRYTQVDLAKVQDTFNMYLSEMPQASREELWSILQADKQTPNTSRDVNKLLVGELLTYVNYYIMLESTQAKKHLHDIMVSNPTMFPDYEGVATQPKVNTVKPADIYQATVVEELDF